MTYPVITLGRAAYDLMLYALASHWPQSAYHPQGDGFTVAMAAPVWAALDTVQSVADLSARERWHVARGLAYLAA